MYLKFLNKTSNYNTVINKARKGRTTERKYYILIVSPISVGIISYKKIKINLGKRRSSFYLLYQKTNKPVNLNNYLTLLIFLITNFTTVT